MNNTIANVPRYRVEKTGRGFWPYCVRAGDGTREVFVGHQKQCAVVAAELETAFEDGKFVSCIAPSPAGVDGLGNTAKLLLPALRQYMHNDGSGLLAGYDLETTQAIIDGLRGEVERLQRAEKNDAIAYKAALERQDELRAELATIKAQGVVMPTVDQAMRVVLREMGSSKHIRGTSNWCADVGRAVLDEVARLNAAPAAPAEDAGLVERVSAFLAKGVVS